MDPNTLRLARQHLAHRPSLRSLQVALNALESLQDAVTFVGPAPGSNAGQWHTAARELEEDIRSRFIAEGMPL